jgi:hypothetical protein
VMSAQLIRYPIEEMISAGRFTNAAVYAAEVNSTVFISSAS